ncbi:MAG TPA: hypothetical protein VGU27_10545, partial [Candidatus Eisenbacteria bacterium]|nr:hypothetical protein [Candidatus Eisenbacteria bacterium]
MNEDQRRWCAIGGFVALLAPGVAGAHVHHPAGADTTAQGGMDMSGMDMSGMDMGGMPMTGMYGPYAMSREASGTAWQPEAARHEGVHLVRGAWMVMLHGAADGVFDDQGGPRGDTKVFSSNMGMAMAQRPLGPGTLGLRTMLSLEPVTIGKPG